MEKMNLFAQITKVNAETGEVHGRITQELPDAAGEVMDYLTSRPYFESWSQQASDATGGLSKGNVRAMHGKVAAGKLTEINFLDEQKAVDVVAKIVDPAERQKCIEGVYTGFSIGGKYAKRWQDGDLWRYTAQPSEVSLVDNPCLKAARFTLVKADGTEEEVELGKGGPGSGPKPGQGRGADKASEKAHEAGQAAFALKVTDVKSASNAANAHDKVAGLHQAAAKANQERSESIKGSKPLASKAYGRAAEGHIRSAENHKQVASDFRALAAKHTKADEGGEIEKAETWDDLKKYFGEEVFDAGTAINALNSIIYLYSKERQEDHPEAAAQVAALQSVIDNLKAFIASEIQEKEPDTEMLMADGVTSFLAKVGARNAKGDLDKIQTIHDHAASLGANCKGAAKSEVNEMQKEDVEKLIDERLGEAEEAHKEEMAKVETANKEAMAKKDEEIAGLKADIETIKANTPAKGGPVLRVVGKSGDVQELTKEEAAEKEAAQIKDGDTVGLIKNALANPIRLSV